MQRTDMLEICRAWHKLGWAVQEQLTAVLDGRPIGDQNLNAMEMVVDFLREMERFVELGVQDYRAWAELLQAIEARR